MATDAFSRALREHMRTAGCVRHQYGFTAVRQLHRQPSPCAGWDIPAGARAVPDVDYIFAGTDADYAAVRVIKLDTQVNCECGKLTRETISIEGTFSELLVRLLEVNIPTEVKF